LSEDAASVDTVFLSVIIPAYNEKERFSKTLPRILEYLEKLGHPYELIVVDDGSTDGTAAYVREAAAGNPRVRIITHEKNAGKGKAVQTGMLSALGEYVIFADADLSTPIETVEPFLQSLSNGFDVVVGNRRMKESHLIVRQPRLREFLGRIFTGLTCFVLRSKVSDQTCGFKGFRKAAASEIFPRQRAWDWAFDAEILHIADRLGMKIRQEPVTWHDEAGSKVKVAGACFRSLKSLFKVWYNGVTGKYR